jgi:hypothetical protein
MRKIVILFIFSAFVFIISSNQANSAVEFVGGIPGGDSSVVAFDESRKLVFVNSGPWINVLDISNPADPKCISNLITGDRRVEGLFYINNFLYIANGSSGLQIINISDPYHPFEAGFYDIIDATGIHVSGSHAYVLDNFQNRLLIIDISDPSNPVETGFYKMTGSAYAVYVSGTYAYLASGSEGLRIIDISDPSNPTETGFYDTPGWAKAVYISGAYAYVADKNSGLRIINVSDPSNPAETGFFDIRAYDVHVAGSYAYVAAVGSGLRIIDILDPSNPVETGFFQMPYSAYAAYISGSYAYVADDHGGLRIIDISNSANPSETAFYNKPGRAEGVFVSGSYAYVAHYWGGLQIVDISDPANPFEIGYYETPDNAMDVFVSGSYAYVADDHGGLRIIDISDSANPSETAFYDKPTRAESVFVSGSYAYIADYGEGLHIIDVSDPSNPTETGFCDTPGYSEDVFVSGSYAYVADGSEGLRIIDVSDPSNPAIIGSCATQYTAHGVYVSGSYAYVADYYGGLRIIDVSDPSNPMETGYNDSLGEVWNVFVSGSHAYISADWSGLPIVDVSDPSNPTEISLYDTPGEANDVYVSGFFIYVAAGSGGFQIYRFISPGIIDIQPTGITLSEPSGTGSFTVKLGSKPTHEVTIDLVNTRPTECQLSTGSVSLNSTNYETGVEVTVTAEDDGVLDGIQTSTIITRPAVSLDSIYNGFNPENVIVTIEDDEKEVGIISVYPTYGIAGQELPITMEGINFIDGTTKVYISDYPDGTNETELVSLVESDTKISLTIPPQNSGSYDLKVANTLVTDVLENAVSFAPASSIEEQARNKAIIVAGGGDNPDNELWFATQYLADMAYFALYSQGYSDESIYYLRDGSSDVNGDGENDVDDKATYDNLSNAIKKWASEDPPADDFLIYLTGQGSNKTFWINYTQNGMSSVSADTLGSWLDALSISGNLVVVYDACRSGSFLEPLAQPGRVVITGTSSDERGWFLDEGEISFSSFFWNSIFFNASITDAFNNAKSTVSFLQNPLMDTDADGKANRRTVLRAEPVDDIILGRERIVPFLAPVIEKVVTEPEILNGETAATISAGPVEDINEVGISSVWSRILPPFDDFLSVDVPVISVPTVRLVDPDNDMIYQNSFNDFIYQGTYDIFVHLEDKAGYQAVPLFVDLPQEDGITSGPGDINLDNTIDLKDLVVAMKVFTDVFGQTGYSIDFAAAGLDINSDNKMGMEEIIYILSKTANLR